VLDYQGTKRSFERREGVRALKSFSLREEGYLGNGTLTGSLQVGIVKGTDASRLGG